MHGHCGGGSGHYQWWQRSKLGQMRKGNGVSTLFAMQSSVSGRSVADEVQLRVGG